MRSVAVFTLSAVSSAVALVWVATLLQIHRYLTGAFVVGSVLLATYGVGWHAKRSRCEPWARPGVQARRSLAKRNRRGVTYFGSLLGVGILTEMTTPLVIAGFLLAGAWPAPQALVYGLGFGIGRSAPAYVGLFLDDRRANAGSIAEWLLVKDHRTLSVTGTSTSLALLGFALATWVSWL